MSYRTSLFVDRLTLTYDVPRNAHSDVLARIQGLINEDRLRPAYRGDLRANYRLAYSYEFGNGAKLYLQAHPRGDENASSARATRGRRFLRLDWNPRKARRLGGHRSDQVVNLLSELIPNFSYEDWVEDVCITRIDLAFDVRREPMNDLQVFSLLRRTFTGHYKYGPYSLLNAIEIGRAWGDKYLRVYDKIVELKNALLEGNADPIECYLPPLPGRRTIPHVRFELQLRDVGSIAGLLRMNNPWSGFTVRTIHAIATRGSGYMFAWFLDSCRTRGVHAALSFIENQRERSNFANRVREASPPAWWDADEIWAELGDALRAAFAS